MLQKHKSLNETNILHDKMIWNCKKFSIWITLQARLEVIWIWKDLKSKKFKKTSKAANKIQKIQALS
jgi:hypothetical protein